MSHPITPKIGAVIGIIALTVTISTSIYREYTKQPEITAPTSAHSQKQTTEPTGSVLQGTTPFA